MAQTALGMRRFTARSTLARIAKSATRKSNRGRSASTAPTAPARLARAWARRVEFDPDLVLPDRSLSLAEKAIAPWKTDTAAAEKRHRRLLDPFAPADSVALEVAARSMEAGGDGAIAARRRFRFAGPVDDSGKGACDRHARRHSSAAGRISASVVCPDCGGSRLRPEARNVRFERAGDSRNHGYEQSTGGGVFRRARSPSRRSAHLPAVGERNPQSARRFSAKWASIISRSIGRPTRSAAASCNACG